MKRILRGAAVIILTGGLWIGMLPGVGAAEYAGYRALDPSQPVSFDGTTVKWNGRTFVLDDNTLFLDYRLERAQLVGHPHAFNNLKDAVAKLKHGTAEKPMLLLTAPGVYWVDDPDDSVIRRGGSGGGPFGMTIACDHLYFYGLNTKRENVVFAVNRGQTQGSAGNFTMFQIQGTGLKSENVTFGNYCNVDLKFPLVPSLGRKRRADAIAQAQLFSYNGGDGVAINSAFVSRLNLLPFARTYLNCHIESSGHAGGQSTYIGCTLEFYGTNFSGGRNYFNCDIYLKPSMAGVRGRSTHRFGFVDGTGAGGVAVDTRFHRSQEMIDAGVTAEVSWDRVPQSPLTRGYQHNVTMDGKPYVIQEAATPGATIVLPANSDLLKAFKVTHGGQSYYNVPNVSAGTDPFVYTPAIKAAAVAAGKNENFYLSIPTSAALRPTGAPAPFGRGGGIGGNAGPITTIRSGQTTANLTVSVTPAAHASSAALGKWHYTASNPSVVEITPGANNSITVAGKNSTAAPVEVIITAKNDLAIEACARVKVEPAFVAPPTFAQAPVITPPAEGRVTLRYALNLGSNLRTDESLITWYRCTDAQGANPLKVAVSRRSKPEIAYTLSEGDVGSYLMATIQPKHSVSEAGPTQTVYSSSAVTKGDVKVHVIDTDFQNLPTDSQPRILPATWTLDGATAPETGRNNTPGFAANPNSWTYGPGQAGSIDYHGLYQTARGARLFYTPAGDNHGDMTVRAKFAPNKNTGQGFGSATNQFLDIYIKYDLATRTGYGLRIQRLTTEEIDAIGFKGAGAVAGCAFFVVQHKDGVATPVSKKIMSSAFVSECTVELKVKNGRLLASASSTDETRSGDAFDYPREVQFEVPIENNRFGGTGMHFTGTVGVNAVHVTGWRTSWNR
jgi:VCBS repeat-containing protein